MYCSQCGREIDEKSRFCYMCGAKVTIPAPSESRPERKEAFAPFKSTATDTPIEENPRRDSRRKAEAAPEPPKSAAKKPLPEKQTLDEDVKQYVPSPNKKAVDIPTEEYIPHIKRDNPRGGDIPRVSGMNGDARTPYRSEPNHDDGFTDDYDPYDAPAKRSRTRSIDEDDEDYDYEEPEAESFLIRHMRGIISVILLIAVLLTCAIYVMSTPGQVLLARVNLAWTAQAYESAANRAYAEGQYLSAGSYMEKALELEPSDYEFAYLSAVCYYNGSDAEKTAAMCQQAISINPDDSRAYVLLQKLYPNPDTRPLEITRILQEGYQRTGDSAIIGR